MAKDNANSTVAEGATTPAPAEPVEAAQTPAADPWDFSNVKDEPAPEPEKPAEPAKEEPKKDEAEKPVDKTDDKSDEDRLLEEAFGEKPKDKKEEKPDSEEVIDKQNPEEMKQAQRNATAKSYLERAERVYTPAKDYKYGTIDAPQFAEKLTGFIGEEKMQEFSQTQAHKLVDENPDAAFHRIFAVKMLSKDPSYKYDPSNVPSLDELLAAKTQGTQTEAPAAQTTDVPAELAAITSELDKTLEFDWRDPKNDESFLDDRELAMAKTIRALEAKAIAESTSKKELTDKLSNLEKSVEKITTDNRTEEQKALQKDLDTSVNEYRLSIETKILPYIQKNTGLEISKDDTPEIVAFKERKMALYKGDEYEKAQGMPSRFERFAYEQSSVKADLENLAKQVVDAKLKAAIAAKSGEKDKAQKFEAEAEELRIPTIQLLAKANDEFKAKYIDPDIKLLGMKSAKVAEPILEAAKRIETVNQGTSHSTPKKREYKSADDVWGSMVEESKEEDRLRSAA